MNSRIMQMKLYFTPRFALFTSDFVSKTIYPIKSAIAFICKMAAHVKTRNISCLVQIRLSYQLSGQKTDLYSYGKMITCKNEKTPLNSF